MNSAAVIIVGPSFPGHTRQGRPPWASEVSAGELTLVKGKPFGDHDAMYPHQIERLTHAVEAAGAEALVAISAANVAYVTGFRSLAHALLGAPHFGVFTRRGTALVVPAVEVPAVVADEVDVNHVVCFGELGTAAIEPAGATGRRMRAVVARCAPTAEGALACALEALELRRGTIGLDEDPLTHDRRSRLTEALSPFRIVNGSAHLAAARRVKAPFEIECLNRALRVAEESLNEVIQILKRGVTEREAALAYLSDVVKRGGEACPSVITMGERTGLPVAWPSERALRPRELVCFDVGCVFHGYVARVGRTAVLGEPTPEHDAAHSAILAGLDAALDGIAPGRAASDVFAAAVEAMREHGLPDATGGSVGHGIGLERIEPPTLAPGKATPLEVGEVLTIDLAHYAVGEMGFRTRETVLVTIGGARVLNRSARGLVTLD
jgi:Xaa-Pro aminopeptidase